MAHASISSTKPKPLTPWKIFTNNGQFNSVLSPRQRHVQGRITSSVDRRGYPNTPIRLCQTARDHPLSTIKTSHRLSSSISSINNIRNNRGHHIRPYIDSQVERRVSSPLSKVDTNNDSITPSIHSHQRRSSHLIENVSVLTRECAICLLDQPKNLFEERYSNQCHHIPRSICDTCIYHHIKSLLEYMINSSIICPEPDCLTRFSFETIRYILIRENNLELFDRYDRQLTHEHLEQMEEFVWCAHNGCGSGQFHDRGLYSNPMIICIKCQKRTCAFHRQIWHIGMTCQEYDQGNRLSTDQKTQIWMKKYSKKCPKCQSYIQKISGCDHMTCKRCKYQFCWQCFADYQQILNYGSRKHMKDCIHYPLTRPPNQISSTQRSTICNIL